MAGIFDIDAIGSGLAFCASVPALRTALATVRSGAGERAAAVLVSAPPGSGKTTLVPPVVATEVAIVAENVAAGVASDATSRGHGNDARRSGVPPVVVTSPRRLTTRAGARRLAQLTGTDVGELVGYTVRGDRAVGAGALVEFVTPGVLLRRLLTEPELPGVRAVVLDEVHERQIDSDIVLAMLAEVAALRSDLTLVAMSATLDVSRFAVVFCEDDPASVPIVQGEAVQHPLDIEWEPAGGPRTDERGVRREFLDHVAAVTARQVPRSDGDLLVFVPGAWEVDHVVGRVRAAVPSDDVEVLPLHGRLPRAEQDRAITPATGSGQPRRVVVSTSVAESSLTVAGVRTVIDAGLSREPRLDLARGMSGLVTVAESKESAAQRAGRAARLGPGRAVRCYDETTYAHMRAHTTAEIATSDLTAAALALAAWGAPRGEGMNLPEAPPEAALDAAEGALRGLGAVDEAGRITERGKRLAAIPVDPRLARGLLDGAALVGPRLAAETVATLGDEVGGGADLPGRVREATRARHGAVAAQARRLQHLAEDEITCAGDGRTRREPTDRGFASAVGLVVALAYPERVARRVDAEAGVYLLASGTRAALPRADRSRSTGGAGTESGRDAEGTDWLAVAEVTRAGGRAAAGTGAVIRAAAPLAEHDALTAAHHLRSEETVVEFADGRLTARSRRSLGAIELANTPRSIRALVRADRGKAAVLAEQEVRRVLQRDGLAALGWSQPALSLRARLALLHRLLGQDQPAWPDVSDEGLLKRSAEWMPQVIDDLLAGRGARMDAGLLRVLVPWPEAGLIDALAPETIPVASGRSVRLNYPQVTGDASGRVAASVKLQECFGMADSPTIVQGRTRVQFHLLSPAGRPLAVTDDLASFWSGAYAHVRSEMRGRYPKHPWPEDPWNATATAFTKGRAGRGGRSGK